MAGRGIKITTAGTRKIKSKNRTKKKNTQCLRATVFFDRRDNNQKNTKSGVFT